MGRDLDRRSVLAAAGALLPAAGLGGCVSELVPGGDDGERPAYARWVPAEGVDDERGVLFVHAALADLADRQPGDSAVLPASARVDPQRDDLSDADLLGALPVLGMFILGLSAGFGLAEYDFGTDPLAGLGGTGDAATPTPTGGATSTESVLLVDGVLVARGAFTADAVTAGLEGFDAVGDRAGYTVYEGTGGDRAGTGGLVFAVRDGTLVVPTAGDDADLRARLDAVLDVRHGEARSLADASADADWLVRTAGRGQMVLGAWQTSDEAAGASGGADPFDRLGEPRGVVAGLTLGAAEATGRFAAAYEPGAAPDRETVRDVVGTSADARTVRVGADRVSVEGTWTSGGA